MPWRVRENLADVGKGIHWTLKKAAAAGHLIEAFLDALFPRSSQMRIELLAFKNIMGLNTGKSQS